MEITMYDTLLQLPLFQGLGQNDFTTIIEKVKLHFSKHKEGEKIITQGDLCNKLVFLLKGELTLSATDKNNLFTWNEVINVPYLIEPQSLFGLRTNYVASYTALTDVQTISIDKSFILSELNKYEVFRINYLNILSNRSQALLEKLWRNPGNEIEDKIISFFISHSERSEGRKILRIKMEDFANILDDTRLNVSKALNELQEANLVELRRKEIEVYDLASLINY